jgi:hypothetical protein
VGPPTRSFSPLSSSDIHAEALQFRLRQHKHICLCSDNETHRFITNPHHQSLGLNIHSESFLKDETKTITATLTRSTFRAGRPYDNMYAFRTGLNSLCGQSERSSLRQMQRHWTTRWKTATAAFIGALLIGSACPETLIGRSAFRPVGSSVTFNVILAGIRGSACESLVGDEPGKTVTMQTQWGAVPINRNCPLTIRGATALTAVHARAFSASYQMLSSSPKESGI